MNSHAGREFSCRLRQRAAPPAGAPSSATRRNVATSVVSVAHNSASAGAAASAKVRSCGAGSASSASSAPSRLSGFRSIASIWSTSSAAPGIASNHPLSRSLFVVIPRAKRTGAGCTTAPSDVRDATVLLLIIDLLQYSTTAVHGRCSITGRSSCTCTRSTCQYNTCSYMCRRSRSWNPSYM